MDEDAPGGRPRSQWRPALIALAVLCVCAAAALAPLGSIRRAAASPAPGSVITPITSTPQTSPTTSPATSPTSAPPPASTTPTPSTSPTTATPVTTPTTVAPYPGSTYATYLPTTTLRPTTTTSTTIAPLPGQAPSAVVTLPLVTKASNAHVDTGLGWLCLAGFAVALLLILGRLVSTRSGSADRSPLGPPSGAGS